MGQIVFNSQKPKYCNLEAITTGTHASDVPKAGEVWLIDSTNSSKPDGTGKYDYYIVGDNSKTASQLEPDKIKIDDPSSAAVDEEDLTIANDVIKFKDKSYNVANFSGLGRKYLRKNISSNKNILTQSMVNSSNTIYHIQYDYDLDGKAITIPEGCTLQFEGGSFANGTLIGNNTLIVADNYYIFKDIDTKSSTDITSSFYDDSDNKNHNYNGVRTTSKVGDSVTITKGTANTLDSVELDVSCGDVFRITGSGGKEYQGNTWRLFTFVDSNNNITYLSKIGFFGKNLLVAAPADGKVYLQLNIDGRPDRETRTYDGDYKVEKLKGYFTLQGTFRNIEFHPEWFGAAGDGVADDAEAIQRTLDITQILERPTQMTVMLDNYYRITKGLIMYACTTLKGHWVHTQNNPYNAKDDTTITCDFQNTSDWAIQSANLNTSTGALLSLRKVLWRTAVDGGDFCYCDSVRIENVSIIGNLNNGVPIYGGIRISASNNSSLSDVKVNNFMVGIARGATWYSSDKDVWASNYYISYIADQDMNNFSVYNAYLTNIASDIEITDDNAWSTDNIVRKKTDIFTNYANGTFINPICENAPNGMTFQNYSTVVVIKPWMESIKENVFCSLTLCNITIFNPNIVIGDNINLLQNATKHYITTFTLIGTNIKGQMDLSENDNVIVYSNGASVPVGTPSGINFYDKSTGKLKHWNGKKWVNEEGYAYQESVKGTYTNRPSVEGMKPGTIYMKEESNGIVRPMFQKTPGVRAKGVFTITTIGSASGDITFTVGNIVGSITVPVITEESIDDFRLRVSRLLANAIGSENVSYSNGDITVYNDNTNTINTNDITFDSGTTGIECVIDKSELGNPPEFVGAFGDTASSDLIVSNLPSMAKNGDIVIWTSIGKPVYYFNNKWRDFTGNSVEGGIELISGEPVQNVDAAAHQIVLTLTSKDAQQQSSQVSVSSDFEGLTSTVELTDSSTSLYTVTINIPMNVDITGRTILYTIAQAASSSAINGSVTQSGISTDVNSFTELASGSALYAPETVIENVPTRPYINTGLLPNNNYKIEIKAKANALGGRNNYQRLFGSGGWNNGQIMFGLRTSGKSAPTDTEYVSAYYNNVASPDSVAADTLEHIYILDGNKFYIDGTLIHTFDEATFSVTDARYKLRIYGIQIRLNQTYFDGSVFYAKIWDENGTLVRDYVPVKHNVVDLYAWKDKVANTIYMSPNDLQFELLQNE